MKKLFDYTLSGIFLFTGLNVSAQKMEDRQRYEHFYEKNFSRSYPASGNTLVIDNFFGNIKIITRDKNEIKVNIHIEASSKNAVYAKKLFSDIEVKDRQAGSKVYFSTKKVGYNNYGNMKSTIHVDYEIYIPADIALDINNTFGRIDIPDHAGKISVVNTFGTLKTGALANAEKISLEFGDGYIKSLGNTDMDFKYSNIEIGSLSGSNKIKMQKCDEFEIGLSSNLSSLNIYQSYGTLTLKPANDLSAAYEIFTNYGSVKDKAKIGFRRTDVEDITGNYPDGQTSYTGKSGSGAAKITIISNYGEVIISK